MPSLKEMKLWAPFIRLLRESKITQRALQKWMEVTATVKELNVLRGIKPTTEELNLISGLTKTGPEINHKVDSYSQLSITLGLKGSLPTPAWIQGRNTLIAAAITANDATTRK